MVPVTSTASQLTEVKVSQSHVGAVHRLVLQAPGKQL